MENIIMNKINLSEHAFNEYSQFGEDGIIDTILSKICNKDRWCVEFGAWDGVHLSNTFNLIKNKEYNAVLIEADKKKFQDLKKNVSEYNVTAINQFVRFEGRETLDSILSGTSIPNNFDFLSIDIDGNDYWIFESLKSFRPKVICIEYNPSIPNEVEYIQDKDFTVKRGSSALSICKLATEKNYHLVATTLTNLIFVDGVYYKNYDIEDNHLSKMRDDSSCKIYAFVGFDGSLIHSGLIRNYWHNIEIDSEEIQYLPKIIRMYPPDYNIFQKLMYEAFLALKRPNTVMKRLRTKLGSTHST
ncbi:MAG: hypothetical protein Rhims3KO_24950 [Hyphomicrobiales bacterium]